jgi:hypothetical protein
MRTVVDPRDGCCTDGHGKPRPTIPRGADLRMRTVVDPRAAAAQRSRQPAAEIHGADLRCAPSSTQGGCCTAVTAAAAEVHVCGSPMRTVVDHRAAAAQRSRQPRPRSTVCGFLRCAPSSTPGRLLHSGHGSRAEDSTVRISRGLPGWLCKRGGMAEPSSSPRRCCTAVTAPREDLHGVDLQAHRRRAQGGCCTAVTAAARKIHGADLRGTSSVEPRRLLHSGHGSRGKIHGADLQRHTVVEPGRLWHSGARAGLRRNCYAGFGANAELRRGPDPGGDGGRSASPRAR